jgi:manganese transport protein
MEGFVHLQVKPWQRRLITRSLAIIPAVIVIAIMGEGGVMRLLVFSQVVLSFQLPFAIVPLVQFTADRTKMGAFVNRKWITALAWFVAATVIALNMLLLVLILR